MSENVEQPNPKNPDGRGRPGQPREIRDERRCTAHSKAAKREGRTERCKLPAMIGTTVCHKHGGRGILVNTGPDNVNWIDGRSYARKYSVRSMVIGSLEVMKDEVLLNQREEISIMGMLIQASLDRLDSGDPGALWMELVAELHRYQTERRAASQPGAPRHHLAAMGSHLANIEQMVERGAEQVLLRKELRETIIDQDKLIRSERKRLEDMRQKMTLEQARALFQMILQIIGEEIADPHERSRVHARLLGLAGKKA